MNNYKLLISYDGTHYSGWQVQPNSVAIQPLIQRGIETVLRCPISLSASGRTDAGVHALGQVAHFKANVNLEPLPFLLSLNALLPLDIRVLKVEKVSLEFHARYSARSKIYHYHLQLDPIQSPFTRLYRYHVRGKVNLNLLDQGKNLFIGTHDFTSFANQPHRGSASRDAVRTIYRIDLFEEPGGFRLEFEADGFLYKMVRNIMGTLLDIAKGSIPIQHVNAIFAARDRKAAGSSAPPHALFLMEVKYPPMS